MVLRLTKVEVGFRKCTFGRLLSLTVPSVTLKVIRGSPDDFLGILGAPRPRRPQVVETVDPKSFQLPSVLACHTIGQVPHPPPQLLLRKRMLVLDLFSCCGVGGLTAQHRTLGVCNSRGSNTTPSRGFLCELLGRFADPASVDVRGGQ